MKTLLEIFIMHFEFLYADSRYRITDSATSGVSTINASLTLRGPILSWDVANDRGTITIAVAPTQGAESPDKWFDAALIRQHLDHYDSTKLVPLEATVAWVRDNIGRVENLFVDEQAARACEELNALAQLRATRLFGPPSQN